MPLIWIETKQPDVSSPLSCGKVPTNQTVRSAEDTAHEEYGRCDTVMKSEYHIVYYFFVG